jgi:lysophospholipase L1-like esterase
MKILFIGDSLTVGSPGASYFDLLCRRLPEHTLVRYARGGDSVVDAYRRVAGLKVEAPFDLAFLWIGVNDVFVKLAPTFPLIRKVRRQRWTRTKEEFAGYYRATLDNLCSRARQVRTVSPLFLGEDLGNRWNRELADLAAVIQTLSIEAANVAYLDLRAVFKAELAGRPNDRNSGYLPTSAARIGLDVLLLRRPAQVDRVSRKRGLQFTLDGAHLNSRGAVIVAGLFAEAVERVNRSICSDYYADSNS